MCIRDRLADRLKTAYEANQINNVQVAALMQTMNNNPASLLSTSYAELRSSFKVGTITHLGIGSVYVQQVNPSSPA